MKRVVGFLLSLLCLAPVSPAAEPIRIDAEFRQAAEEGTVSVAEILRRLNASLPAKSEISDASVIGVGFEDIYTSAAQRASGPELEELRKLLLRVPRESLEFTACFASYVTAEVMRRTAELSGKPIHPEWPRRSETVPENLATAPKSLQEAWKSYRAAIVPYQTLVRSIEAAARERTDEKLPALSADLQRVLSPQPEPDAWRLLARHQWSGFCWTGSEMLYHPRNRALLLSFLADGKFPEAAGAVLDQYRPSVPGRNGENVEGVVVSVLKALGLDWGQAVLGSFLDVNRSDPAEPWSTYGGLSNVDAWSLLAARGSDETVRACLDFIRWGRLAPRDAVHFCAVASGVDSQRPEFEPSNPWLRRVSPLGGDVRREVRSVLTGYLAPTNNPASLMATLAALPRPGLPDLVAPTDSPANRVAAVEALPQSGLPDLRDALKGLLAHPLHPVAREALLRLKEVRLATGDEKIVPAPLPLNFRIVLNGQPLTNTVVSAQAIGKGPTSMRAIAPEQRLTTDSDGEIRYRLDDCLEPEHVVGVRLSARPESRASADHGIPGLFVPPPTPVPDESENVWPGPYSTQEIPVVSGDDRVREVQWRGSDLEIKLAVPEVTASDDHPIVVLLLSLDQPSSFAPWSMVARVSARLGENALFQRLQQGTYAVEIAAPGIEHYESGKIVVGETAQTHAVRLQPGRDVRGTAVFPNGDEMLLNQCGRLFRDGKPVEMSAAFKGWSGLGFGKYTVKIASVREEEEQAKARGESFRRMPAEDRYGSLEFEFILDDTSPATLELGEISVPPEKKSAP